MPAVTLVEEVSPCPPITPEPTSSDYSFMPVVDHCSSGVLCQLPMNHMQTANPEVAVSTPHWDPPVVGTVCCGAGRDQCLGLGFGHPKEGHHTTLGFRFSILSLSLCLSQTLAVHANASYLQNKHSSKGVVGATAVLRPGDWWWLHRC